MKTKEEILARFKESIALKKRVMEEAEQRTVEYYEEFFRNNGFTAGIETRLLG